MFACSDLNNSPTWGLHQSACCIKILFACVLQICIGHAFDEQRIQAVLTKVSIRPAIIHVRYADAYNNHQSSAHTDTPKTLLNILCA